MVPRWAMGVAATAPAGGSPMQQVPGPSTAPKVIDGGGFLRVRGPLQHGFERRRQLLEPVRSPGQAERVLLPAALGIPKHHQATGGVERLQRTPQQQVGRHLANVGCLSGQRSLPAPTLARRGRRVQSSRIASRNRTTPMRIAASARLKSVGQTCTSMKSVTLPTRTRSTRLPRAPPATAPSAPMPRTPPALPRTASTAIAPTMISASAANTSLWPEPNPSVAPVLLASRYQSQPGITVTSRPGVSAPRAQALLA